MDYFTPPPSLRRKALAQLRRDQNIAILPVDKGRSTVVLNTVNYQTKVSHLFSDTKKAVKGQSHRPLY